MKFIQVSIVFLLTVYCCQAQDFINFGDGRTSPQVIIGATNKNNILTVTTTSIIIRDSCDQYDQTIVTTSVRGIMTDMKTSCTQKRVCGGGGRGDPGADIDCNVYLSKL